MTGGSGRRKNVTGAGTGVGRRGSGLGTGPVGRPGGYSGRTSSGSSGSGGGTGGGGNRGLGSGGGIGKIILIVIIAAFVLGGGFGLGNCLGGFSGDDTSYTPINTSWTSDPTSSVFSGFSSGSSSSGWVSSPNTGSLDTGARVGRSKYTTLKGGGQDKVKGYHFAYAE